MAENHWRIPADQISGAPAGQLVLGIFDRGLQFGSNPKYPENGMKKGGKGAMNSMNPVAIRGNFSINLPFTQ